MAGKFFVIPFEVFDQLQELNPGARDVYYNLLRFHYIDEDWDAETEWVSGRIRTTKVDIWRLFGMGKGHFYEKTWPNLIESGLVSENGDGTISITKLKKKIDEGINPSQIRELAAKIKHLESAIKNIVDWRADVKSSQRGLNSIPKRTDQSSLGTFVSLIDLDLKISLSAIDSFYKGIGQEKIAKRKRERALKIYQKLIEEGFSQDQIQFAVEWTVKNAKEKLYDFAILEHTIGEAMAEIEREEKKRKRREEKEQEAAQKEREEGEEGEERRRVLEYKESLNPEERKQLQKEAEAEIKESGQFKDEFIDDFIIEIRENMILRRRLTDNDIEN